MPTPPSHQWPKKLCIRLRWFSSKKENCPHFFWQIVISSIRNICKKKCCQNWSKNEYMFKGLRPQALHPLDWISIAIWLSGMGNQMRNVSKSDSQAVEDTVVHVPNSLGILSTKSTMISQKLKIAKIWYSFQNITHLMGQLFFCRLLRYEDLEDSVNFEYNIDHISKINNHKIDFSFVFNIAHFTWKYGNLCRVCLFFSKISMYKFFLNKFPKIAHLSGFWYFFFSLFYCYVVSVLWPWDLQIWKKRERPEFWRGI